MFPQGEDHIPQSLAKTKVTLDNKWSEKSTLKIQKRNLRSKTSINYGMEA